MAEELEKVVPKEPPYRNAQHAVYFILGALEILLLFRLILKMTGANPGSGFVAFVYSVSNFFVLPFQAIFSAPTAPGAETTAIFEPSTLIGMIVYAVIALGVVKLIGIVVSRPEDV